jgi:acyl-coenzyme A synthetase/AMP-(fatty) acid ligase
VTDTKHTGLTGGGSESARPIPRFLTDFTPTRYKRRLSPFSRLPAVAKMGDIWHGAAERNPHELIIVDRPPDVDPDGETVRTYEQWAELIDRMAASLHMAGVREWDRVAVLKRNHLDISLLATAIARLGAIPAPLSGSYDPWAAHPLLQRLERPFVVADDEHVERCGLDKDAVATLTVRTISLDGGDDRPDIVPWAELQDASPVPVRMRAFHEPEVITHTSGTTGIPKLVMHSAESVYSMGLIESERWPGFGLRSDDTVVFCDPYSHERLTTLLLAMTTAQPRVVFVGDPLAPNLKNLLAQHRPTIVEALPNIYLAWEHLATDEARLFRNVRLFVNSFDAIHTRTMRKFLAATERRFPIWIQSWSQSEQGSLVFRPFIRSVVKKVGRRPAPTQLLGWPVPFYSKHRAVDPETGKEVRRGEVGLIEVNQPGRCLAYVGEQHRHDIKVNGDWWNTGDLGIINRWGAVRIVDREIDRIPGASAIELEDVLLDRLPTLTEVVVLPRAGERPVPVYSTQDDVPLDERDWTAATQDMPTMADPIHIRWDEFPRTGTWKIRRVELRERLFEGSEAIGMGTWT